MKFSCYLYKWKAAKRVYPKGCHLSTDREWKHLKMTADRAHLQHTLYLFLTRRTECPEHFSRSPTHMLVDVKVSAHARSSEAIEDDQYDPFCPD